MKRKAKSRSELTEAEKACGYETLVHINQVGQLIYELTIHMQKRGLDHDKSKLIDPEISIFTQHTPKLKSLAFGSEEYKEELKDMGPAIQNHYAKNRHHPEHFPNGIDDMNLIDIVEMLADWKASTLRNKEGNIAKSLELQRERFKMSDQLYKILHNTIVAMGWE